MLQHSTPPRIQQQRKAGGTLAQSHQLFKGLRNALKDKSNNFYFRVILGVSEDLTFVGF
jgi:hypothetical protein